jgi:hypothetical protein
MALLWLPGTGPRFQDARFLVDLHIREFMML